jgi:hypothetical protein
MMAVDREGQRPPLGPYSPCSWPPFNPETLQSSPTPPMMAQTPLQYSVGQCIAADVGKHSVSGTSRRNVRAFRTLPFGRYRGGGTGITDAAVSGLGTTTDCIITTSAWKGLFLMSPDLLRTASCTCTVPRTTNAVNASSCRGAEAFHVVRQRWIERHVCAGRSVLYVPLLFSRRHWGRCRQFPLWRDYSFRMHLPRSW